MSSSIEQLQDEFDRFVRFGRVLDKKTRMYFVRYLAQQTQLDPLAEYDLNETYFKEFKKALDLLFENEELREILSSHERLSKQIALDILYWFRKTIEKISDQHPYQEEERELESWGVRPMKQFLKSWKFLLAKMGSFNTSEELDTSFYEKKFKALIQSDKLDDHSKPELEEIEYLFTDALGAWDARLQARILDYQLKHLKEEVETFTERLNQKVAEFNRLNNIVHPFAEYAGNYWDMSRSLWEEESFESIQRYNDLLRDEKSLLRLTDLLGKLREAEIETEEDSYEQVTIHKSWRKDPNLRTEINGIRTGNDLSQLAGTEISLLADELTEDVFLKRYADSNLLNKAYEDEVLVENPEHSFQTYQKTKLKEKGPFIVCVDTSGSMEGDAERIAKVLTFAIMKMAAKDNRKAYLINFSSGVKTINLHNIATTIGALAKFLSFSFHGGTDISLALDEALNQLKEHDYKEADVLVVSDFLMYKIEDEILERMDHQQQHKNTQFHSLIISDEPSTRVIEKFDNVWQYDPEEKNIIRQLYLDMKGVLERRI